MPDFGHALAIDFPISSYIPQANVNAVNTGTLRPDAALHRNRYGALPSDVKGFPADHLQHGQSTFWLSDLFKEPAFLAEHPAFSGVVVAEPPSSQDYTDLCFAASPTLGGAYGYLKDWADRLGLLGSASGTGPHREPGGGARPVDPPPAAPAAPAAGAALPAPATPPPAAPIADQTLRQALEARFPGKGNAYANALNDLDGLGAHPDPGKLLADLLPLFGGSLGSYGPMVAMVLSMALGSGK